MTGPRCLVHGRPAVAALAAAILVAPAVAGDAHRPLPFSLAVRVDFGEPAGPARLAEELRRRIVDALSADGVVIEIVDRDEADLTLDIVLDEYLEETRYPVGMYQRLERDDPVSRSQYTVAFEVLFRVRLVVGQGGEVVRSFRFKEANARAPRWDGEDVAAAVRDESLASAVRAVRKKAFRSPAKLEDRIRAALAAPR